MVDRYATMEPDLFDYKLVDRLEFEQQMKNRRLALELEAGAKIRAEELEAEAQIGAEALNSSSSSIGGTLEFPCAGEILDPPIMVDRYATMEPDLFDYKLVDRRLSSNNK